MHSDMNNFYASVECMLNPSLKGKPVAVCGNTEQRHGIVLAKNYEARAFGIQTGEVNWQAKRKCPELIMVEPHYEQYIKYSRLAREIYARYTDLIEPFGMDECWLDVSGSTALCGSGKEIADKIRESVKFELGITVSLGVSFNKIFAKLGSDLKKPDAVTVISRDDFKTKIWDLPACEMLGVGRASWRALTSCGIYTIGELARADPEMLRLKMHSHGINLSRFANGLDTSAVCQMNYKSPIKSIGHGITARRDLENENDVLPVIMELSYDIGHKLRENRLAACGLSITVRDCDLFIKQWQSKMPLSTQSESYISKKAFELFQQSYSWDKNIRSITLRAIDLIAADSPVQLDFIADRAGVDKLEAVDKTLDEIRQRFGEKSITKASLMLLNSLSEEKSKGIKMPTGLMNCI